MSDDCPAYSSVLGALGVVSAIGLSCNKQQKRGNSLFNYCNRSWCRLCHC